MLTLISQLVELGTARDSRAGLVSDTHLQIQTIQVSLFLSWLNLALRKTHVLASLSDTHLQIQTIQVSLFLSWLNTAPHSMYVSVRFCFRHPSTDKDNEPCSCLSLARRTWRCTIHSVLTSVHNVTHLNTQTARHCYVRPHLIYLGIAWRARVDLCLSDTYLDRYKDNKVLCSFLSWLNLALHENWRNGRCVRHPSTGRHRQLRFYVHFSAAWTRHRAACTWVFASVIA